VATNGRNHSHSPSELDAFEVVLTEHFRHIGLVGEFTLAFSRRLSGSSHSRGLTILGMRGNTIRVSYQPGGNDTRFVYAIHMPAHLVRTVHENLSISVKAGLPKPVVPNELLLIAEERLAGEVVSRSAPVADAVTITGPSSREVSVEVGMDLSLVSFAGCVPEAALPTLRRSLEAELRKVPHEGIFTVKCGGSSTQFIKAGDETFCWCNFQVGARGLGFWHRVSLDTAWVKYALIADKDFDIKSFAEKLGKVPESKLEVPYFRNPAPRKLGIKDYVADAGVIEAFLNALAKQVLAEKLEVVPSGTMTKVFQNNIDSGMSPISISRLTREWVNEGYLGSSRATPMAQYNVYFLRGKAEKFLLPEYQHLVGKALKTPSPVVGEVINYEEKGDEGMNTTTPSTEPATAVTQDAQLMQVVQLVQKLQAAADKITLLEARLEADAKINAGLQIRVDSLEQELTELRAKSRDQLLADLLAQADAIKI